MTEENSDSIAMDEVKGLFNYIPIRVTIEVVL